MIKPTLSRFCLYFCCTFMVQGMFFARLDAQTVIGGDTIDQSAVLDIQDTARGVLLSRLTTTQRNAIVKPAFGLLILNTTRKCLETNIGTPDLPSWKCLTTGIPQISDADTLYWNGKLGASDTLSLSNRIDGKIGLPPSGNSTGDMLFWNGSSWVKLSAGQNGQILQLINGLPAWAGAAFASLTTNEVTEITGTTATVGGNITNDGGGAITARGVVYNTAPNPVIGNSILSIGTGTGTFSDSISGLTPTTLYYLRAFATNSAGTTYGNEVNFTTGATVPTISTNTITNISNNSAVGGGNITSDGGSAITSRGLVYGTSPSPTLTNTVLNIGTGAGTFSDTISGLSPNTTYYVRAFATNSVGTAYGNEEIFSTQSESFNNFRGGFAYVENVDMAIEAQQWQYIAISKDNNNQAKVYKNGQLAYQGNFQNVNYVWNRLDLGAVFYTSYNQWFNGYIDGIRISNKVRTASEIESYFNSNLPLSSDANTIGLWNFDQASGTTINASVGSNGTITNAEWNDQGKFGQCLSFNGTNARAVINQSIPTSNMTFEFWIKPNIAQQSWPISWYGLYTAGFTTGIQNQVPTITTSSISSITSNSANGGGNITSGGGSPVTARGLVYSTSPSPTLSNSVLTLGSETGTFSGTITGLSPNTTYYVRAFATNSAGTAYGNEVNFTTGATVPTISTNTVTSIMNNSAVAGGNITSDGGSPVTARGVVYGTSPSPTLSNSVLNIGSGTGTFTGTITGLTPNTTYYVRAFATNGAGTAYGNEVSFTNLCGAFVASGVWKNFMCHNLGAANTSADPFTPSWEINGGYWQWGRKEMAAAGPSGPDANQANDEVIAGWNTIRASDGSWSDANKTNNDPCPVGFRVPTRTQWQGIISNNAELSIGSSWLNSITNSSTGRRFGQNLFLPAAGWRYNLNGILFDRGVIGSYWSSTSSASDYAWYLHVNSDGSVMYGGNYRSDGFPIRCIEE